MMPVRQRSINILKKLSNGFKQFSTLPPWLVSKKVQDKTVVILNKPQSLNIIDDKLPKELITALKVHESTSKLVILKSAGERAFCAGGDLKKLAAARMSKNSKYLEDVILYLNASIYLIYRYKIPIVALMDGITMGGGAGISAFATYRVVTEKTIFAMPETKFGLHPNCAGTYFLNRAKNRLGYYLALTSNFLRGSDVFKYGFATHYCLSKNLPRLEEMVLNSKNIEEVKDVIDEICEKKVPDFSLNPVLDNIERCFSGSTVEEICANLKEDKSDWANETFNIISGFSPTSLKVTLRQLQKGSKMNLIDMLIMEQNLTLNFYDFPDVLEGTRVLLKDKGARPRWSPSKLEEVTEDLIEAHFKPVKEEKQRQLISEV